MKKPKVPILVVLTLVFAAFTAGLYTGRNSGADSMRISVSTSMQISPPQTTTPAEETVPETTAVTFPIDINLADKEEFMALPGIGDVLAQRIVDYRTEHGAFSSPEHLLNVRGIGKIRMEEILELITVGGLQ